jgi:hypothetical protein
MSTGDTTQATNLNTTNHVWHGVIPPQPQPCPSCGHCPTCGRGRVYPNHPWTNPSHPYWWTTTGGNINPQLGYQINGIANTTTYQTL